MRISSLKITAALGLFLLLLSTLSMYLQLALPRTTGPFAVGRTIFHWVDFSRPEILTDDPTDFREVMAFVWYPAEPGTGTNARYFPGISILSDTLSQSGEVTWWQLLGLRFVRSVSPLDARSLKSQAPYPVVIFSPGNGTNIEFYSILAGEIASHGYVVVGLNHPYDVPAVQLSNGDVALYDKAQWSLDVSAHQAYTQERMKVRTADIVFALDQLEILDPTVNNPLSGIMDLELMAVAGHSLGGIAASEACKADLRFQACLNLDGIQMGGPFSMESTAIPPRQPFLFLTKESRLNPVIVQSFGDTSESYWVVVHGASHDSFTDGPILQPSLLPIPGRAELMMRLIQRYTLAFLDQTLNEDPSSLLAENSEQPNVSVRVFPSG